MVILTWSQLSDIDRLYHGDGFLKPEMDVLWKSYVFKRLNISFSPEKAQLKSWLGLAAFSTIQHSTETHT